MPRGFCTISRCASCHNADRSADIKPENIFVWSDPPSHRRPARALLNWRLWAYVREIPEDVADRQDFVGPPVSGAEWCCSEFTVVRRRRRQRAAAR